MKPLSTCLSIIMLSQETQPDVDALYLGWNRATLADMKHQLQSVPAEQKEWYQNNIDALHSTGNLNTDSIDKESLRHTFLSHLTTRFTKLFDNMKVLFIVAVIIFFSICGNCQTLKKERITKNDRMKGISFKFNYSAKDSYGLVSLILKKDNTFYYSANTIGTHQISEGTWKLSEGILILESTFQMNNFPAEISNGENRKFVDSCDIAVVENVKHELLTDAFVVVNNDTIKCLPMIGMCKGEYEKIDSVKIAFENGMSSGWIPIKFNERKIALTVLTEIPIGNYVVMNKRRFKLDGNYLRQL
ncbi:hypothetical protein [[Flexibacter] sp. ATCC 35208]|uniref:hypothetical protein n=1 Tax=[Flexibacter] sp. ATCC 35208 TaxID=1936242 RepID=UPI00117D2A61|nr:hypothetical protein [[Flexibacter] sp. ATCC 35208]